MELLFVKKFVLIILVFVKVNVKEFYINILNYFFVLFCFIDFEVKLWN